jgi:hypothetical protein
MGNPLKDNIHNELFVRFISNAEPGEEIIVEHNGSRVRFILESRADDGSVKIKPEKIDG